MFYLNAAIWLALALFFLANDTGASGAKATPTHLKLITATLMAANAAAMLAAGIVIGRKKSNITISL